MCFNALLNYARRAKPSVRQRTLWRGALHLEIEGWRRYYWCGASVLSAVVLRGAFDYRDHVEFDRGILWQLQDTDRRPGMDAGR
jgi:hypothetical protein